MGVPKIKLGICMAGAVSAGAFTAGAIDYLVETLERWEERKKIIREKKKNNEPLTDEENLIPDYDVSIEILSGASAGGMTAAVLGYSLLDGTYVNKKDGELIPENYNLPDKDTQKSKLYNAWVNMADEPNKTTLDKLLDTRDVKAITKMNALLNSDAINEIADKACPTGLSDGFPENFPDRDDYPSYFSKDLSIFLTVTNLEGLPIEIKFGNTSDTKNQFKMHSGFLHYSFKQKTGKQVDYPSQVLDKDNYKNLLLAAKSTGAFPVGLANQKIRILKDIMLQYQANMQENYKLDVVYDAAQGDYKFTAVDGGLINNEPMGTTAKFLNNYTEKGSEKRNYLILIDPFPNITNADEKKAAANVDDQYNIFQIITKMFGAVRNQSMFRQEDLLEGLNMEKNKYLIYPSKKGRYFLACGLIGGFSGFMKKAFREHDYQLGRKNAQSFLRYYFGEDLTRCKELDLEFSAEQQKIWGYYPGQDDKKPVNMPLIPDMLYLNELSKGKDYTEKSRGSEVETPAYNGLETSELKSILKKIGMRSDRIIDESFSLANDMKKGNFIKRFIIGKIISNVRETVKEKTINFTEEYLANLFNPQLIKQDNLVKDYANTIAGKGKSYKKYKGVFARVADAGEHIVTFTSSGKETMNTADSGDYIVTNDTQAKEQYVIEKAVFERDYEQSPTQPNYYFKKGKIYALPFTNRNFPNLFEKAKKERIVESHLFVFIEAAWKESQILRENDYLVCDSNKSEVYRIDKKEFEETYQAV